ncbi:MAG: FAD-dependent oxidoreductase, partial [Dehalococcoidia bacterium]
FYPEPPVPLESFPEGYNWHQRGVGANIPLAEGIKKQVSVPVTVVGKLDPVIGEKILREGKVDFIGMTRRLIADPDLPNKVATGRYDEIVPCTACLNCLGTQRCRINTFLGTGQNKIEKADTKKKVVVIGGGPGGMEAARVAAERGHDVTLIEKSGKLGGLLPLAALVKGTEQEDLPAIVNYYKGQLSKLGVKQEFGKEVDVSTVLDMKPDVVVVATGGVPVTPDIPGINNRKVVSNAKLHKSLKTYMKIFGREMLYSLTKIWMPVGKNVVIIGGGIHGLELSEFLIKRGRNVTIVESSDRLGEGMVDVFLVHLTLWFERKGIPAMTGVKYEEITDKGLTITTKEGERKTLEADTIIPALPLGPNTELADKFQGKVSEVYAIGDCKDPLLIADAIGTAAHTLWSV